MAEIADGQLREQVRDRYAKAAAAVAAGATNADVLTAESCRRASGGIDVLLSARRVGPTGFAYGIDMTEEMLTLAEANKAKAAITNVEFGKGSIEDIPLPDAAVDVVISNCVINLSVNKPAVFAEMLRALAPSGRIGICDVVAEDHLTAAARAQRGSRVGCIAGALSRQEYLDGLPQPGSPLPQSLSPTRSPMECTPRSSAPPDPPHSRGAKPPASSQPGVGIVTSS